MSRLRPTPHHGTPIDRQAAEQAVAGRVVMIGQYQAVSHTDARELLGDERFGRLLKDPLRKVGPTPGYVYPWSVADYVQFPDLRAETMESETMTCPDCNGDKALVGMFPKYADHVPQSERKAAILIDCPRCQATGSVPAVMAEWIAAGEKLRAKRREGGMGLREFCVANGINVLVRSNRERGSIDPTSPDVAYDWGQP